MPLGGNSVCGPLLELLRRQWWRAPVSSHAAHMALPSKQAGACLSDGPYRSCITRGQLCAGCSPPWATHTHLFRGTSSCCSPALLKIPFLPLLPLLPLQGRGGPLFHRRAMSPLLHPSTSACHSWNQFTPPCLQQAALARPPRNPPWPPTSATRLLLCGSSRHGSEATQVLLCHSSSCTRRHGLASRISGVSSTRVCDGRCQTGQWQGWLYLLLIHGVRKVLHLTCCLCRQVQAAPSTRPALR